MDAQVPLVEAAREHGPEADAPDPVGSLLEPHVRLGEHLADVHPLVVPAHAAVAPHAADPEVPRVLQRAGSVLV